VKTVIDVDDTFDLRVWVTASATVSSMTRVCFTVLFEEVP